MAACAIVAIEHPVDVSVISSKNSGQRAVLKSAAVTGAPPTAGHFTPGTSTKLHLDSLRRAETPGGY